MKFPASVCLFVCLFTWFCCCCCCLFCLICYFLWRPLFHTDSSLTRVSTHVRLPCDTPFPKPVVTAFLLRNRIVWNNPGWLAVLLGRGSRTSSEATKMSDESTHVSLFPANSPRRFVAFAPLRFPSPPKREGEGRIYIPLLYKLNNNTEPPPSHF